MSSSDSSTTENYTNGNAIDKYSFLINPKPLLSVESGEESAIMKMYSLHVRILCMLNKLKYLHKTERTNDVLFLTRLYEDGKFQYIEEILFEINEYFSYNQLSFMEKNVSSKWSAEAQGHALYLYFKNRRLYKYLSVYFEMPYYESLEDFLESIPCTCGIIAPSLEYLKFIVPRISYMERYCVLVFGYMPLTKYLSVKKNKTRVLGFEDFGKLIGKSQNLADHTLVFMVRSFRSSYNIPIAYYYFEEPMRTTHLSVSIVEVIKELRSIGMTVCATVCDHSVKNNWEAYRKFIREGGNELSNFQYQIGEKWLVAMFDPSHLIIETRNALARRKLEYEEGKYADMDHVKQAFLKDKERTYKYLWEFDENDFKFEDRPTKKNLDLAVKQLSYKTAVVIETCSKRSLLGAEAMDTAEFCNFIYNLFNSLNCCEYGNTEKNPYRYPVTATSPHLEFWSEALERLENWRYLDEKKGGNNLVLIKSWQATIESAIDISKMMLPRGVSRLSLRNLNMEPLENLFDKIRERSFPDFHPTCRQVEETLKIIISNNCSVPGNELYKEVHVQCEISRISSDFIDTYLNHVGISREIDRKEKKLMFYEPVPEKKFYTYADSAN